MKFLRRITTRQLFALCAAVALFGVAVTGLALAMSGGGPKPQPKSLPAAIREALAAPAVGGVSGRVEFTNHLISGASIQGSDPLLSGASGRFWASSDGHLRVELQSDISGRGAAGDVQILADHSHISVFDSGAGTAYEATLPPESSNASPSEKSDGPPSVDQIRKAIDRVMQHANLSGAIPSDVAGQPAYTLHVSPKQDGGLLGGAELAWDAVHGTPLRAAVFARGDSSPVLELKVTDISFGPVPDSVFAVAPPPGTKITKVDVPSHSQGNGSDHGQGKGSDSSQVTGLAAVRQHSSIPVSAPASLAGMNRAEVRQVSSGDHSGALVTYGQGLGGIAVLELPADSSQPSQGQPSQGPSADAGQLSLPSVSINGAKGQELPTALGTVIRFTRAGVQYVVAGSVTPAAAEAAARGL